MVDTLIDVVVDFVTSDDCVDCIACDDSGTMITISEDPSNVSIALPSYTGSSVVRAGVGEDDASVLVLSIFVEDCSCSPSYS